MTNLRQHRSLLLDSADTGDPVALSRPALLMVEGTVADSSGAEYTYSSDHLERIANATDAYIKSGNRVIFTKDHGGNGDYKQDDIMGRLESLWTQAITEETIPHQGMADLIGKTGLYGQITIAGKENVARYQDGRIKEISVGIDIGGDFIGKDIIFEVSAVWKGAIRGASLFGLTLDGTLSESSQGMSDPQFNEFLTAFSRTISSIKSTTETELNGRDRPELISNAIDDLELKLRQHLGATRVLPVTPNFTVNAGGTMPNNDVIQPESSGDTASYQAQVSELTAQFAALKAENEALKIEQEKIRQLESTRSKWSALRERAHALCLGDHPKLTPAAFKSYFGATQNEAESMIMRYANPQKDDGLNLATVEAVIMHLEQYGQPITTMGSALKDEPIEDRDAPDQAVINGEVATLKRLADSKGLTKDQAVSMFKSTVSAAALAQFQSEV